MNVQISDAQRMIRTLLIYAALLLPSFLVFDAVWLFLGNGVLYICTDNVPVFNLLPPFVHGAQVGDRYLVAEPIVYTIWTLVLSGIFITPLVVLRSCGLWSQEKSSLEVYRL